MSAVILSYPSVRMTVNGKRKHYAVHSLVAAQFLPDRPSQTHEVRHLNGDKTDNRADNLAWGTRQENADDRERHGRTARGEKLSIAIRAGGQAEGTRRYHAERRLARAGGAV